MSLRIGVDLDGTLANLSKLYREYEKQFETPAEALDPPDAEHQSDKVRLKVARMESRRHKAVWKALQETPDLWTRLEPIEEGAVHRLHDVASALNWEVFFITQRPRSAGASVQRQTQQWLVAQGYPCPSVLTLRGPRGKAAHALDLDFLLDDLAQNCVDVVSDSKCRPILVLRESDATAEAAARQLKIGIVRSIHEAVDVLSQPPTQARETTVARVLKRLGFAQ